jgi:hypothetical protein
VRLRPRDTIALLETLLQNHLGSHVFWPDSISLADRALFRPGSINGHRQITDVYLLGLCQFNGGTLVTFDTAISVSAIVKPHPNLLLQL